MEFRVDRIDNEDGTHCILVDHVKVGPSFPWDDLAIEHYVRQTCLRIQRSLNGNRPSELVITSSDAANAPTLVD